MTKEPGAVLLSIEGELSDEAIRALAVLLVDVIEDDPSSDEGTENGKAER